MYMEAETPNTRGFTSTNRLGSPWRSRLARTTAAAVGVLTMAGVALVGTTTTASAGPSTTDAAQRACFVTQLLRNRSFEQPIVFSNGGSWGLFTNNSPGIAWQSLDGNVELWRSLGIPHTGNQHAEINANADRNIIWQAFPTRPRTWLSWSVALKARNFDANVNWDTTVVRLNGDVVRVRRVNDRGWTVIGGVYRVPRGQWFTRLSLQSVGHAGPAGYGNLVDTASVRGVRCF
jgi:hypothetical protein